MHGICILIFVTLLAGCEVRQGRQNHLPSRSAGRPDALLSGSAVRPARPAPLPVPARTGQPPPAMMTAAYMPAMMLISIMPPIRMPPIRMPVMIFLARLHPILWHPIVLHQAFLHPDRNIATIAHHRDIDMAAHMPACQPDHRHHQRKEDQSRAQIGIFRGKQICPEPV